MVDHNIPLIVMMIVAIILLFVAMIFSSMASSDVKKTCPSDDKAHKYSMYSAVVAGVAVFLIAVALMIYIFRQPIVGQAGLMVGSAASALQQHASALQQHAAAIGDAVKMV